VPLNCTDAEFGEILMRNPGESSADALAINSNDIAFFSSSDDWAIAGSRDWEIAIVGFTSLDVKNEFIDSFGESADMFTSVEKQVEILDEMLNFNSQTLSEYEKLVESYRDVC
jgi:hypothetical protein